MGTLWYGGTFYTLRDERETVDAVFVDNGIIEAIGSRDELISTYADHIDKQIDVKGAYIYPGFVDSHLHMIMHGEKLIQLDLSNVHSADEMKELLCKKVSEASSDDWIIGEGWNENNFADQKIFNRYELDEIAPNNPMMLTRVCRHAILANSAALTLAGIDKHTNEPTGGVIVRNENQEPTGYLLDHAQELVKAVVPTVSEAYIEKALSTAVKDMVRKGLVGGHTEDLHYYGGFERTLAAFKKVIDGTRTKFRAHLLVHHEVVDDMAAAYPDNRDVNDYIELGAMKIFADGALGGRTALLSEPYDDDPTTQGVAIHPLTELKQLVKKARHYNMPVAIHTIGDLALEYALTAIEAHPLKVDHQRDRLIHTQVIREDLVKRMRDLPVILDIQPRFVVSDFPWVEERLGEERLQSSFAWKTLLDQGLHCAGGSDAPIEPVDPLLGIHASITRKKPGQHHQGYLPEQKLSRYEAVKLFTQGSAYAIGKEQTRGCIATGFVADFTALDRDLFAVQEDDILNATVEMTVVDDTIMYERN
ncbi:amidohydrolase [Desertibacillus haloalkaliphilus]|uniref:amidohydrolase n=1 Tax=Desertibacillus haloalkaliphilus TaxID=1328930 RepID=UPI001C25E382|nr:amidohydrolase [Desertibacillus haloalkaliphilus]MBU8905195.1 amidohydrolase [Desertibacillus haloalkaliphilus]